MTAKKFFTYIVSLLMLILPAPGRFSCGIVIVLLFNLIVCAGTLFSRAVVLLKLENLYQILMVFFLLCVTIFYRQLLILFSPVLALTLGITLFVTTLCAYEMGNFADFPVEQVQTKEGMRLLLSVNMRKSLTFSLPALGFFLLREIIGYGAISLPAPSGMIELVFPFSGVFVLSILWASIPGAIILTAAVLSFAIFVYRTILEIRRGNTDVQ
jgi:hypothetical protein